MASLKRNSSWSHFFTYNCIQNHCSCSCLRLLLKMKHMFSILIVIKGKWWKITTTALHGSKHYWGKKENAQTQTEFYKTLCVSAICHCKLNEDNGLKRAKRRQITLQVLKTSDESSFKYGTKPARVAVQTVVMPFLSCWINISCAHVGSLIFTISICLGHLNHFLPVLHK